MDLSLEAFIETAYADELVDTIKNSFDIMDAFNYDYNEQDFIRPLMEVENQSTDYMHDMFLSILNHKLDLVLKEHTIVLNNAKLYQKNEFLEALFVIQHLNDYSPILYLLESDLEADEKLAEIIAQLSTLTPSEVISIVDNYDEEILEVLKQYIYQSQPTETSETDSVTKQIITKYKEFYNYLVATNTDIPIGVDYFEAGILPGLEFKAYLHYFNELTENTNISKLSLDILSILLLARDSYLNPLTGYRDNSGLIFSELELISKIDASLTGHINKFETYKQATSVPSPEPLVKE
jgi:hypothetical protein